MTENDCVQIKEAAIKGLENTVSMRYKTLWFPLRDTGGTKLQAFSPEEAWKGTKVPA
jgi:hypothetical protein